MVDLTFSIPAFLKAFTLFFAIMNPFETLPVFIALTEKLKKREKELAANQALIVAGSVVLVFIIFGKAVLGYFGISLGDFQIAGGIVLLVMGLQIVLGIGANKGNIRDYHVAATIIGVPLITGPGTITTTIVLVASEGVIVTFLGALASLLANWFILRESVNIYKYLGANTLAILSRVMALLLMAVAVSFIRAGFNF